MDIMTNNIMAQKIDECTRTLFAKEILHDSFFLEL